MEFSKFKARLLGSLLADLESPKLPQLPLTRQHKLTHEPSNP